MTSAAEPVGYQCAVYTELRELARDYFEGEWHSLAIDIRIVPLVCGSTGAGKTFLARRLAAEFKLPLFIESVGDWMLLGANHRGAAATLPRLYTFIDAHERGVIVLDELEKLGSSVGATDWRVYQQLEIFGVVDRVISQGVIDHEDAPRFVQTPDELAVRFRRGFFIIGCGAWQTLWSATSAPIGFRHQVVRQQMPTHAQLAATLRLELLNRFSSRPLFLPPLTADDYRKVFDELADRLPPEIQNVIETPNDADIGEAVAAQKGFRYFEELLARAIRARRVAHGTSPDLRVNTAPESPQVQPT